MIELALAIVALAQSGLLYYILRQQKEERAKMLNAIVSKNAEELVTLEAMDKAKPKKVVKEEDKMTPVEQLTDDEFKKYVLGE